MIKKIIVITLLLLTLPFVLWNVTVAPIIGIALLAIWFVISYVLYKNGNLGTIFAFGGLAVVFYLIMLPLLFSSITAMSSDYNSKIQRGKELTPIEVWNIYGLHLAMIGAAAPIYPELSLEVLLMHVPNKSDTIVFHDDFFLKSDKLRHMLETSNEGICRWKHSDFYLGASESRVALALTPTKYKVIKDGDNITYETSILVGYNPKAWAPLIKDTLIVHESLFYYLEKIGLLHRYMAIWRTTV